MSIKGQQQESEKAMEAAGRTTTDPAILAAAGSVVLSLYYYFVKGNKESGTFVGLWPPTILAFASYYNQTDMSDKLDQATNQDGVRSTVERLMGNQ